MVHYGGFNTRAVHSGELRDPRFGNVVTPIFETTTFLHPNDDSAAYIDATRGSPYLYTRWGNPTIQALEEKYSALENSNHALAFSSGMGAITSTILSLTSSGSRILSLNELYGQAHGFFSGELSRYQIKTDFVPIDEINSLSFKLKDYAAVYVESITNPTMKVTDLVELSKFCNENNTPVVVDATFASPYNQKPLDLGCSIVIHSGTKYLSGHSDVTLGMVAASSAELHNRILRMRTTLGPTMDPLQSYLALRGIKTLGLRMEKHNRVALEVAKFLSQHKKITGTFYPGLPDSKYHNIAKKVLTGFGGMLSFEVTGGLDGAKRLLKHIKIASVAASLGGVDSLVSLPLETSHANIQRAERLKMGINDGLVRFSCGIEDPEDLILDIESALDMV